MKNTWAENFFSTIIHSIIIIYTFIVLYPFLYCVVLSFNDGRDAIMGGIYFWPRIFTLDNYAYVFSNPDILVAARTSILRTITGIVCALFVTSMAGYVLSKSFLLFRKFYMIYLLITMFFSGGLIPYILVIRSLGLYNNFFVYVLPVMFSVWNSILFMAFFRSLPDSLEESAKIDGANDFFIFIRIVLPLSKPVLATIALFVGVGQWNAWFDTMLFTQQSPHLETLSHILMKMINAQRFIDEMINTRDLGVGVQTAMGMTSTSLRLATMVVTAFPIIVLYPFLQKYFVKGVMIGSIKG